MNNAITMTQLAHAAKALRRRGERFTMLGIGPMSSTLIRATLELAQEKRFPVLLIASRNQVDSDEFGAGYVCGWSQKRFADSVRQIADAIGYDGLVYLCRDHGGPWQRDEERAARLPAAEAMAIAKRSYVQDMRDGFDLLHIDPTKDPHCAGVVPLSVVLDRTVELIAYLEEVRRAEGLPEMAYEVGTEETNGGLTSHDAFGQFIGDLGAALRVKELPLPVFVVGQTGTLTRRTENVGHYDTRTAQTLAAIAERHGVGIKEHNADYLRDAILFEHPVLGIDASNVAPEFGVVETRAYLELARVEETLYPPQCSGLRAAITEGAVRGERWRKWMVGPDQDAPVTAILADADKSAQVAELCGHYTFDTPPVKAALATLTASLAAAGIDVPAYAAKKLRDAIDRYVYCLGQYGLTDRLLAAAR